MHLLLIDYLSPKGHVKFDKIHISALLSLDNKISVVGREGHFASFEKAKNIVIESLPDWTFKHFPLFPITERLLQIARLFIILKRHNFREYDAVIFLSYDVMSLWLFRCRGCVFLINHNNVSQLDNSVKKFLTQRLPNNYRHVALNILAFERLKSLYPNKEIDYVPHGYDNNKSYTRRPDFIHEGDRFIFCPVNRNYDDKLINTIVELVEVQKVLEEENLLLYFKIGTLNYANKAMIKMIPGYLSEEEYNYMIQMSQAVLLPYGTVFKYRSSGIFYECVASDIPIIATKIPDLLAYKKITNISYFDDSASFVDCIKGLKIREKAETDKELFNPVNYWRQTLSME